VLTGYHRNRRVAHRLSGVSLKKSGPTPFIPHVWRFKKEVSGTSFGPSERNIWPLAAIDAAQTRPVHYIYPLHRGVTIEKLASPSAVNWKYAPEYYDLSKRALDTALAKVPAYRSWRGLDPGPESSIDSRFGALPALTKKIIRDNFPQGILPYDCDLTLGINRGEVNLVDTSGTTDDKVTNIWNQKWWDASERSSWKLNTRMAQVATGSHPEAILVNPKNVGIISDGVDLPFDKRRLSRFLFLNEKTDPLAWTSELMGRMISELEIFRPAVLEANPSYLTRLCRFAAARGLDVYQPGIIVFTYEYPSRLHYRQIERVFPRVPTASSYGTTETGYVFMQCENGKLHQNSDFCRVDFQPFKKEHGGPLLGRILVTPLNNPWSYFLRFDTGDIVELAASGACECGRNSGLILKAVAGRKVNLTVTSQGRLVTLMEVDNALSRVAGLAEYKLVQTAPGAFNLQMVAETPDAQNVGPEAAALLKQLYGNEAAFSVKLVTDLGPENSGKYLLARSLVPIDLEQYLEE